MLLGQRKRAASLARKGREAAGARIADGPCVADIDVISDRRVPRNVRRRGKDVPHTRLIVVQLDGVQLRLTLFHDGAGQVVLVDRIAIGGQRRPERAPFHLHLHDEIFARVPGDEILRDLKALGHGTLDGRVVVFVGGFPARVPLVHPRILVRDDRAVRTRIHVRPERVTCGKRTRFLGIRAARILLVLNFRHAARRDSCGFRRPARRRRGALHGGKSALHLIRIGRFDGRDGFFAGSVGNAGSLRGFDGRVHLFSRRMRFASRRGARIRRGSLRRSGSVRRRVAVRRNRLGPGGTWHQRNGKREGEEHGHQLFREIHPFSDIETGSITCEARTEHSRNLSFQG